MREFVLRLATLVGVLTLGACMDSPTGPDQQHAADLAALALDTQVEGCVTEGICILPPISGGGCEEWDYSCDGGGDCAASMGPGNLDGTAVQGCDDGGDGGDYDAGGGSGGGGGTKGPMCPDGNCDSPLPADTCRTGDPIVDDPQVSQGLATLWNQSNPDANLYQRVEKAGWIVEYPVGQFSIMQFTGTERFGCGDYRNIPLPARGKVVGFVHTHPYEVGEMIVDCNLRNLQAYDGTPSEVDRKSSVALGNYFGLGRPLTGYTIDKDGYYRYDGQSNTATPRRQRCGY